MSPFSDTEDHADRVSRRAKWIIWATIITLMVAALTVVAIVQQTNRSQDLADRQEAATAERFRNTLFSCEEQNKRNELAKEQLGKFLKSLPPREPQSPAQRRQALALLNAFVDTLANVFVPTHEDMRGRSTCESYAQSRVQK